jgi:ubiquinone/menaquinone biosynthesis C-methylase UbiE
MDKLTEEYRRVNVIEGYDIWASTYDGEHNPLITLEENITLDLIGDVRDQRVLDVGCGTGRYCKLLAEKGAFVAGIDPSSKMLEQARKKITTNCRFELHLGRIEEVNLASNHFDVVVSALTVGHIIDLTSAMEKISRVIRRGGLLVISDMHPYWFVSGYDYVKFLDRDGQEYRIPEYPHLLEEYWNLFRQFKFHIEDIKEPKIDDKLLDHFPNLLRYKGMPLALILKSRKS